MPTRSPRSRGWKPAVGLISRLLPIIALVFASCAKKPQPPSEAEVQANAVLNATFVARNAEFWYAARKSGTTLQLIEFHRPSPALLPQSVSETDQMNGVTERYNVTLTAAQYRYWNGQWTEWHQGTQGGAGFVNALVGGLTGFWTVVLEKKNGAWQVRPMLGNLLQDRPTVQRLLAASGGGA